ncbi:MAG: DUF2817 domain-containing protein [Flavobacteriales bacterium]|nr:DUF2817 domain-containing protein [Flavobacteriales bacterium]
MKYLIILGILLSFSCKKLKLAVKYYVKSCPCDGPVQQSDFPQEFLEINIKEYYQKLLHSKGFTIDTAEVVHYNLQSLPIISLNFAGERAKKKLLVFAGVHGNEVGGVLAIPNLLDSIYKEKEHYQDWDIQIVTPINPIGVIHKSRYNQHGCDLNRNMKKSDETEIKLQKEIIDKFKPDLIISLHESPSKGYFIFPGPHLEASFLLDATKNLENSGIQLAHEDYFGRTLKNPGISNTNKGFIQFLNKIVKPEALDDQLKKQGIASLTPESGWNSMDQKQRVDAHVLLILYFLRNYEISQISEPTGKRK